MKAVALDALPCLVVTEIGPVVAPVGTRAWISESDLMPKMVAAPLKVTLVAPVKPAP